MAILLIPLKEFDWFHFALVWDEDTAPQLFINGEALSAPKKNQTVSSFPDIKLIEICTINYLKK